MVVYSINFEKNLRPDLKVFYDTMDTTNDIVYNMTLNTIYEIYDHIPLTCKSRHNK